MNLLNQHRLARRSFLRGMTFTSAFLASHTFTNAFADDSNNNGRIILGTGKHRFEWVRGWGKLPEGKKYGSTHGGVVVDSQNHIYFSTDGDESIIVLDKDGKYVRSIGKEWHPDKDANGTHDMQLYREGGQDFIYLVSLFRHEFAKMTTKGEVVWVKGFPEQSGIYQSKEQFRPSGITVAPNGDVYVTDGYGLNYIHRYNSKAEYISSWGGKSTAAKEDGKFNTPHKIIIDQREKQPLVLVTDRVNHRLQWFTLEGKHIRTVDGSANDLMRLPSVLSIHGTDLAIGDLMGRVTILDKDHKLVTHMGENRNPMPSGRNRIPPEEWTDGVFVATHGLTWDKQGDIYISEYALAGRVIKLKHL